MTETENFLLRKNDRIVFLGDSITEQQLYTNYVETYLAARYPELKLTFLNAGWGGDSAPGGVQRLSRDVLTLHPTVVTVCYGMNDGRYVPPTDEIRTTYRAGMEELVCRLEAAGVRIVLLTPGMVDENANPNLAQAHYNHGGLKILVDEVLALAAQEHLPVANLHQLMNEVDARAKAANPAYCMIPDGVHPDPAGQLVMAYGLLQALGVPPRRLHATVNAATGTITGSRELRGSRVERNPYGLFVTLQLDGLPFYVEPMARKVLPFLPFQQTFNELTFSIHGIQTERAYFRTEAFHSASIPRENFEAGINLFSQWSNQAMRQAEVLHRYTLEKDQIYFKAWRNLGLDSVNSPYYNAAAHTAGIRMMVTLERGRAKLVKGRSALSCALNIVATDVPGEPLHSGDFISQWSLRGPFPKPFETDALEGEVAFSAQVRRLPANWLAADLDIANPGANLIQVLGPQTDCFAYAVTLIRSPTEQTAELFVGSDDGVAAWLNGQPLLANLGVTRGLLPDQERAPVNLRKGDNVLLLKITQGIGAWGFCARLAGLVRPVAALRPDFVA